MENLTKQAHSFCETPKEKCTMNYCDENGCQNRKRELVEPFVNTMPMFTRQPKTKPMKKLTAVELLVKVIKDSIDAEDGSVSINWLHDGTLDQANKLFEEQIVDGWHNGYNNQSPMIDEENCGEQYYNETFNQSQS